MARSGQRVSKPATRTRDEGYAEMMTATTTADLERQRVGVINAEKRWGPRRCLNLGDLDADRRRAVLLLVEAQRSAQARQAAEA